MYDENEETFTYQPTSFVTSQIYVNPDSPRHFKNKRRRQTSTNNVFINNIINNNNNNNNNNDNYNSPEKVHKLKNRPQSLIDFQFIGRKSATKKASECRRSKTVIERCRGAIRRAISMETLLDDDDSAESTPSSRKKTTISRLKKTRDGRKVNEGSNLISLPLLRSKSEVNIYHTQDFNDDDFNDDDDDDDGEDNVMEKRQSISGAIMSRPENYVVQDAAKDAETNFQTNLNRDNSRSFDSLITHSTRSGGSTTSSPNSSGFYECTGSEHGSLSRGDSLSSNGSVGAFKKHRNQMSNSDKTSDKYPVVEERECTQSWNTDRKPLSVIRSTSKSKSRGRPKQQDNRRNVSPPSVCFSTSSCPSSISGQSPTQLRNEVFTTSHEEDQRDSGLDIPASNKISQRRPTPKHPKNKRWCVSEELTAVEIPCDVPTESASKGKTNTLSYSGRTERRESTSLEETVEKLSVTLRQTNLGYSNIGHSNSFHCTRYPASGECRERKRVEKSRSVGDSSSYNLPSAMRRPDTERRKLSYYRHIKIESVL